MSNAEYGHMTSKEHAAPCVHGHVADLCRLCLKAEIERLNALNLELSRANAEEVAWLQRHIAQLEQICAAAYQLAGVVGAPVRFLDALSRFEGDIDSLLPVSIDECDEFKARDVTAYMLRRKSDGASFGLFIPAEIEEHDATIYDFTPLYARAEADVPAHCLCSDVQAAHVVCPAHPTAHVKSTQWREHQHSPGIWSQCDGRYAAPPPRDEAFEVTYRCRLPADHAGPHGAELTTETSERARILDAAAATGNVEHYTATVRAMIDTDESEQTP